MSPEVGSACFPPSAASPAHAVPEPAPSLADEWDDVFAWSYGQRVWNVGCG